ncbi:PIN domain-containing protein [Deferrisoma palaeochoriense]
MTRLVDSVILIDHLNGVTEATDYLRAHSRAIAVSVITRAEVLAGLDAVQVPVVRPLLDALVTLPVDVPVADAAARLRREYRWKLPDALQAAVALHHGLKLVTRNTKDFPPQRFSFVEVPYRL